MVKLFKKLFHREDSLEEIERELQKPLEKEPDFSTQYGTGKSIYGDEQAPSITPVVQQPVLEPTRLESNEQYILKKDLEVISSKLDAIKAVLESLNQRIANIERIAMQEEKKW